MIEPDPSIANPDHTWRHVVSDVGLCPKLSPFIEDLNLIAAGQLSLFSVGPGYPKLRRGVVFCQRRQGLPLVVEGMEVRQCSSEAQRQRIRRAFIDLVHRQRW